MKLVRRAIIGVLACCLIGVTSWLARSLLPGPALSPLTASAQIEAAAVAAAPAPIAVPPSPQVALLRADLTQIVRSTLGGRGTSAILVVSLDRADTLFSLNPDVPLAPASNMKLFTTAAALYYLGPDFRFSTYVLGDGEIRDGVLEGDVVLYGTGDPTISSRMLETTLLPFQALADSLKARGIREIRGDVVGDGSYFGDQWIADGWKEQYRLDSYSAPIGALSLAENVVSIRVQPGASAGETARVSTTPETDGLLILNRVQTVSSGGSSVRFSYDPAGLVLEGQLRRGHPGVTRTVSVVDPANFAAASFRRVLEGAGISVSGEVRTIRSAVDSPIGRSARPGSDGPPPRVLGTYISPTLGEVISVTNHVSQNLYAEAMFKTVGRIALGEGTFEAGSRAVQYFLECEGPFDFSGIRIVDGSGLSPLDRVTARLTIHLLDLMRRTEVWEDFHASLPEAASPEGGNHSLRNRMGGTAAALNLHAKTGTISNVSSLSGYVEAANGEILAFSILGNDLPSTTRAKRMEDAIGARLARFSRPDPEPAAVPVDVSVAGPASSGAANSSTVDSSASGVGPFPSATENPPTSPSPARSHEVASGETLDGIARQYGVSVDDLEDANPQVRPRRLQIGQTIRIPPE